MAQKVPAALWVALAVSVVILIAMLVFRKDLKSLLGGDDNEAPLQTQEQAEDQVESMTEAGGPNDGSVVTDALRAEFMGTAEAIAESQFQEMNSYFIDEVGLLNQLYTLNGAQLRLVFEAYGAKQWTPTLGAPTYLNLFQWYAERLDSSTWTGNVISLDWSTSPEQYIPTSDSGVSPCDGAFESCSEKMAMRAMWWRSGLTLTF